MNMHAPALRRRLADIVEEYDAKRAAIPEALAAYGRAVAELHSAASIGAAYGGPLLRDSSGPAPWAMEVSLLKSAWQHVYDGLNVAEIAPAADKWRFEQMLEKPPAFTLEEIRERFGDYLLNPRHHILRGLAEVFCSLDPAYRSHSKVKIGVAGLPKRVILRSVGGYGAWGTDRLRDVLNALAAYQRLPLVTWPELSALLDDGEACRTGKEVRPAYGEPFRTVPRGVRLRRFANGNGHLFFEELTLRDINRAPGPPSPGICNTIRPLPVSRGSSSAISAPSPAGASSNPPAAAAACLTPCATLAPRPSASRSTGPASSSAERKATASNAPTSSRRCRPGTTTGL